MQEAMRDPEVKSFVEKVMKKLGPLMGMMGGDAMPGFGSATASSEQNSYQPSFEEEVD